MQLAMDKEKKREIKMNKKYRYKNSKLREVMIMRSSFLNREKGSLLMVSVIALVVLSVMGLAFLSRSNTDLKASSNVKRKTASYYAAESAVEKIVKNLMDDVKQNGAQRLYYEPSLSDPESGFEMPENIPLTVDPITNPQGYLQECALYLWTNPPPEWGGDTLTNLIWGCSYLYLKNSVLPNGLSNIDDKFDIELVTVGKMDAKGETKTLEDKFTMPNYIETTNYTGLNVTRRIYSFIVRATSKTDMSKTTLEATVSIHNIPIFQWLFLSDDTITMMPGSHAVINGRLHSNKDIRAATIGGPIDFIPNDFESGTKALTATGNIWRVFKANYYNYRPYLNTSGEWRRIVQVETEEDTWVPFHQNLQYGDLLDSSDPAPSDCADRDDPECWVETTPHGYTIYSVKVDTSSAALNERLNSDNKYGSDADGYRIYPPMYQDLKDEDMTSNNNAQRRIIEPGYSNVHGIPYNFDNMKIQKWGKTNIKVLRGEDGTFTSIDGAGNKISSGPFSYEYLRDNGIITFDGSNDFYLPTTGRIARTITVDINALKNDPQLKNYSIKHIYVGSLKAKTGEIHYPDPACNPDNSNGGVNSELCVAEDGSDCTQECDPDEGCVQACNPNQTGEMDIVMLKNGSSLPVEGLTVSTNLMTFIQGDFNTDKVFTDKDGNKIEPPAAVNCDMLGFLSNSWDPSSWSESYGWQPSGPKGPPPASQTTYNLAYMIGLGMPSGMEHPLIESWGGSKIIRNISALALWRSDNFPPKNGGTEVNNWYLRAWKFFYTPAKWITKHVKNYGIYPPPSADHEVKIILQSIKEIPEPNV